MSDDGWPGTRPRSPLARKAGTDIASEPPVVARLLVEIRSDGSRTIARGALEDTESGETVSLEARGDTPLGLAAALLRSMAETPLLIARMMRPREVPVRRSTPLGLLREVARTLRKPERRR